MFDLISVLQYTHLKRMHTRMTLRPRDHHTAVKGEGIAHTAQVKTVAAEHCRSTPTIVYLTETLLRENMADFASLSR